MYFDAVGKVNTKDTAALVLKATIEKNIKYIVATSLRGNTAKLLNNTNDINIICVTHANGYPEPGESEMSQEIRSDYD